jgi:tripartite-type tricarboxylate transporter receptor subunit TctC
MILVLGVVAQEPMAQVRSYPTKPMRWEVPFAPGGGTDVVVRPIAQ